jgi:hypothetical protein
MTGAEAYELTTQGGATDFARLIKACESFGPYCLIGGLAVNCYVEPVYALDVEIVVTRWHAHSMNDWATQSDLRIQLTTDDQYQAFLPRSVSSEVLGIRVKIASLEDLTQGKLWVYTDPHRRLSKRKKDELDCRSAP